MLSLQNVKKIMAMVLLKIITFRRPCFTIALPSLPPHLNKLSLSGGSLQLIIKEVH